MSEPRHPASFRRTAVRGSAIALAGFALTQVLNFGVYIALAALVTPGEYGIFVAGSLVVGVAALFAESGFMAALIQRETRLEEAANTALISTFIAGLGLSLLALLTAPLVGAIFADSRVTSVAAAMSGWLLVRNITIVPHALLQRRFSFVRRVIVEPLGVLAFGATALVLCSDGAGQWGLVAGMYAAISIQAVAAWVFVRWRPRLTLASVEMWKELARYGRHVIGSELLRRIESQVDVLIVGRLVGLPALGQYRYGLRIANQPLLAWVSVGAYILFPVFARIQHQPQRMRAAFSSSLRWMSAGTAPLCFVLLPLGVPLAVLLFGSEWRVAGEVLMALFLYPAGQALVSLASETYKGTGNPQLLIRNHLFSLVASTVLMLLGATQGVVGVAAGLSIAAATTGVYGLFLVCRLLDLGFGSQLRLVAAPVASGAIMALAVLVFDRTWARPLDRETLVGLAILAGEALVAMTMYTGVLALLDHQLWLEARAAADKILRRARGPRVSERQDTDG